jgi:hypothetical protein
MVSHIPEGGFSPLQLQRAPTTAVSEQFQRRPIPENQFSG